MVNHLMSQKLTYKLFNAILDQLLDINLNNKTFLNKDIWYVKASFWCIIHNIPQAIMELLLFVFSAYRLKEQDCSNFLRTHPNQDHHTFLLSIIGKELIFFTAFYWYHPKDHVEPAQLWQNLKFSKV